MTKLHMVQLGCTHEMCRGCVNLLQASKISNCPICRSFVTPLFLQEPSYISGTMVLGGHDSALKKLDLPETDMQELLQ